MTAADSTVKSAQGATLTAGTQVIGQVTNISFSMNRGTIETSTVVQAIDTGKTFIAAGLYDLGELSFDLLYDPASTDHQYILDGLQDAGADTVIKWTISVPQTSSAVNYIFDGFVTGWDVTLAMEDAVKASVSIKLTDSANENIPVTD